MSLAIVIGFEVTHLSSRSCQLTKLLLSTLKWSNSKNLRARLVHVFKHMFSIFKQHYTYFHNFFFFFVLNKMGMGWSTMLPYQCMTIIASTLDEKQMSEGLKIGIKVASVFLDELSHSHWVWSEPSLKSIMSIDKTFVINLEMVKL